MKKNKTIVIKVGTKVITTDRSIDKNKIRSIVEQIADIKDGGSSCILVTSGAIGAGMGLLGMKKRPASLPQLQCAAAVGQGYLMHVYSEYFRSRGYTVGQILLTQEDFNDRSRYLNIKNTLNALISHNVIPVINENDTVSTDEIKFGDNDRLAWLVSDLCRVSMLILLTDVDGLLDKAGERVRSVDVFGADVTSLAKVSQCDLGTGGMLSKLEAARCATRAGIECIIANGNKRDVLLDVMKGSDVGTSFKAGDTNLIAKKRWIAFSSKPKGSIIVDRGAEEALIKKNKSLLASGIVGVNGDFSFGDVVSIENKDGAEIARGRVNYSKSEIDRIKGLKTSELRSLISRESPDEVIHKDDLVTL